MAEREGTAQAKAHLSSCPEHCSHQGQAVSFNPLAHYLNAALGLGGRLWTSQHSGARLNVNLTQIVSPGKRVSQ